MIWIFRNTNEAYAMCKRASSSHKQFWLSLEFLSQTGHQIRDRIKSSMDLTISSQTCLELSKKSTW